MSNYFKDSEAKKHASNNQPTNSLSSIFKYYNAICDKMQIYPRERWSFITILVLLYVIRLIFTKGYHALTYCIGIHILNSFIGFISPLEDSEEVEGDIDSFLPQKNSDEFKPFQRKVREFRFWTIIFYTFLIGIVLTFFDAFNIPVFWPLLLVYFALIFFLTMRKQIQHMIKYKYMPWDAGKAQYKK